MNDITEVLREHDPARGKSLTAFDRTRILNRALASPRAVRVRVAAVLAMLVLVIAAAVAVRREKPAPRQIQYATPGGTRIVWTLDPDFHM